MTYRIVLHRTPQETVLTFSGQLDLAAWQDLRRILSELGGGVVLELDRGSGIDPGCLDLLRAEGVVTRTKSPYLRALLDGTRPSDAPGSDPQE
jgi:hypothetical protein